MSSCLLGCWKNMEHRMREEAEVVVAGDDGEEVATGRSMENRVVRDVVAGAVEASSRNRVSNGELNSGGGGGGGGGSRSREQVIGWERFLPRRFLRVLLVENDDSTRHIVAALLRKCSYQVTAVADGLKAWEVLKEKQYNFDLVLTEVVMPSLSGIGLLCKIMSNDICENIPVIMMSSHDSIGIVFKCMQKGAADFLVKPVRKNELRNLWQHVWRKYCVRLEAVSDNDAASNHGSANACNKSKMGNSSNKESDTQSSCSKPETENKSLQKIGESLEIENKGFPKETDLKLEKHEYNMVTESSMLDKGKAEDKSTGVEVKVTLSIQGAASNKRIWEKNVFYAGSPCREEQPVSLRNKEGAHNDPVSLDQTEGTNEPSKEVIDFIGAATAQQYSCSVLGNNGHKEVILSEAAKTSDVKSSISNSGSLPLWELSLRRSQFKGQDEEVFQEKHVLNHSDASPFSRYASAQIRTSCPRSGSSSANLCVRASDSDAAKSHTNSSSNHGNKIPFPLIERLISPNQNGDETLICCHLSSSSKREDGEPSSSVTLREDTCVGHSSTEKTVFSHPQLGFIPLPIPVGTTPFHNLCAGYGTIFQPVFYPETSTPLCGSSEVGKDVLHPSNPYSQDSHIVNDLKHDGSHDCVEKPHPHRLKHPMEESRDNNKSIYPRKMLPTPTDIANQLANCSHGITDANGSNDSNRYTVSTGAAVENGNEDGSINFNRKVEHDHSRREAALTRFHLKRKDRCFEKKVRYHSRQKLAEQRPRLKGQFVRQSVAESTMMAAQPDN
ncbi:PREDICTED: two-component response regulator-like APRR3 isoform X2 [Nelumbo nucifera]|uniref:Two-component response regulator-like APRR3 isoform X2 n=1 Tax=Nelumbo nucifera TaxID=4432 RepID=A0A1U8AK85_NELNU|nr:PREDICTED: two-component response regulator-like APRR3 isoform X2 [Nelumbo nucifera]